MNNRRSFLFGLAALPSMAHATGIGATVPGRTYFIQLGKAGGPRSKRQRAASLQVVVVDGMAQVFDCGDGVARQLVVAKIPLRSVKHVLLTHHNSDHTADYGNLLSSIRGAILFVPQTRSQWQKLYLLSTPVTLGIVGSFAATLSWR